MCPGLAICRAMPERGRLRRCSRKRRARGPPTPSIPPRSTASPTSTRRPSERCSTRSPTRWPTTGRASKTGRSSPTSSPARSPRSSLTSRPRTGVDGRDPRRTSGGWSSRTRPRGTTPGSWPTSRRRAPPRASRARCSWRRSPRTCSCGGRRRSGRSSRRSSSRGFARRSGCPRASTGSSPTPPRSGR